MQIYPEIKLDNIKKTTNTNFRAITIPNKNARIKILETLNNKQIVELKQLLLNQKNNPVNAYITLKGKKLAGKIYCPFRLKNFKEDYKQFPLFESNFAFIKRIAKKCEIYKKQLF